MHRRRGALPVAALDAWRRLIDLDVFGARPTMQRCCRSIGGRRQWPLRILAKLRYGLLTIAEPSAASSAVWSERRLSPCVRLTVGRLIKLSAQVCYLVSAAESVEDIGECPPMRGLRTDRTALPSNTSSPAQTHPCPRSGDLSAGNSQNCLMCERPLPASGWAP
ncbi:hypothetical protein AB0J72_26105 [Dactylosporangium sp. NPDC049742]|uniref:hypothetical protein n=1 Tax=Dactylosporangium sp. NPDC049742 TaxID=3154737 RepID=UPI00343D5008